MRGLGYVLSRLGKPRPTVGQTPADVVHRENKWRLLRYRPRPEGVAYKTPILIVPSLINRWYVLDLVPGKSFVEWLVARGHDVFMLDWGTPGPEDRYVTFDDVCDRYVGRALRIAASSSPRGQTHLLGYCMGGILTAVHAAARPERVASMVALAAPIRFDGTGLLGAWTRSRTFDVGTLIDAFGNVPWPLMQASFHMLRPTLWLQKLVHVIDRAWDDESFDGFLALETWGSDNVSFPGECYRRYIEALYQRDELARGVFTLSGRPAKLSTIRCPVLAVTFENDTIVPWRTAAELVDLVGSDDKRHLHLPGGHVGAVVSRSASKRLWPELAQFWSDRDEVSQKGQSLLRHPS